MMSAFIFTFVMVVGFIASIVLFGVLGVPVFAGLFSVAWAVRGLSW